MYRTVPAAADSGFNSVKSGVELTIISDQLALDRLMSLDLIIEFSYAVFNLRLIASSPGINFHIINILVLYTCII